MKTMDYALESREQLNGQPKKTDIVREVTSMTRISGVMCFKTKRNGMIRRRDDTWDLIQLRRPKLKSRWN